MHQCSIPAFGGRSYNIRGRSPGADAREGWRAAFTEMAQGFVEMAASAIPEDDPERRRKALAILAQSVGSVIMARAVADEEMSDAILAAGREALARLA